jgi:hypothetical protein
MAYSSRKYGFVFEPWIAVWHTVHFSLTKRLKL